MQRKVKQSPTPVPIYLAEFATARGSEGTRAFSAAGQARQWVLDQIERDYDLEDWETNRGTEVWQIREPDCRASVLRIQFHDPKGLKRAHPEVFR